MEVVVCIEPRHREEMEQSIEAGETIAALVEKAAGQFDARYRRYVRGAQGAVTKISDGRPPVHRGDQELTKSRAYPGRDASGNCRPEDNSPQRTCPEDSAR